MAASLGPPCDSASVARRYRDTTTGQRAWAYPIRNPKAPRALVAVSPPGSFAFGYLLLTTCSGTTRDSLRTGGVISTTFRRLTPRHRPEAIVRAVSAGGTGVRVATAYLIAVVGDSLHLLWARPYLEAGELSGNDSAAILILHPGALLYRSATHVIVNPRLHTYPSPALPYCFAEHWRWQSPGDTFAMVSRDTGHAVCPHR